MKDPLKLKALILEKVDLAEVMLSYDTQFMYSPLHVDEAQFRCPFHGKDNKPSGRYYRSTQTCYCWVCVKSWDVISFIKDKEGTNFISTLNFIVKKFQLDTSSIPDGVDFKALSKSSTLVASEEGADLTVIKRNVLKLRKKISFERYRAICCFFQMIIFRKSLGLSIIEQAEKLRVKIEGLEING